MPRCTTSWGNLMPSVARRWTRDSETIPPQWLQPLGPRTAAVAQGKVFDLHYGNMGDSSSLHRIIALCKPTEVYNLAAQSHVAVSFETPEYTANADAVGTLRLLEAIREDPTMADDVMGSADYLRVELYSAARSEMVTRLEDFMRRRSKIALVVPRDTIRHAAGLMEACRILFGKEQAQARYKEYFGDGTPL